MNTAAIICRQYRSRAEALKFALYADQRRRMEALWELVKPIKFPNRRRREDREVPKAA